MRDLEELLASMSESFGERYGDEEAYDAKVLQPWMRQAYTQMSRVDVDQLRTEARADMAASLSDWGTRASIKHDEGDHTECTGSCPESASYNGYPTPAYGDRDGEGFEEYRANAELGGEEAGLVYNRDLDLTPSLDLDEFAESVISDFEGDLSELREIAEAPDGAPLSRAQNCTRYGPYDAPESLVRRVIGWSNAASACRDPRGGDGGNGGGDELDLEGDRSVDVAHVSGHQRGGHPVRPHTRRLN